MKHPILKEILKHGDARKVLNEDETIDDELEDLHDEEAELMEMARLIRDGYTSGVNLSFKLKANYFDDSELDETDEAHIADMVEQGYSSGELVKEDGKGNMTRGWWEVKR